MTTRAGLKFGIALILVELAILGLYIALGNYGGETMQSIHNKNPKEIPDASAVGPWDYPLFQDVHVMIFVGFGFLMTFLRRYGYSAISLNLLIASVVIQLAMIFNGVFHTKSGGIWLELTNMIGADFAAAAILISFGALLGRTSPLQLLILAVVETILFAINEYIGRHLIHAVDIGDSIFVHVFGAYFGLAASRMLYCPQLKKSEKARSSYNSDLFSMIGTIFLWVYWPSFNGAAATGGAHERAVLHTYLSIAASCVITCACSVLLDKRGRMRMEHLQNATLAGGVAIGASADFILYPFSAIVIGSFAGALSVLGFQYVTPALESKLKIHDTCGVHNLHGMPGVMAAIVSAIVAASSNAELYSGQDNLWGMFPAMAPRRNESDPNSPYDGQGFTAGKQAGAQMAAFALTLVFAIVGGCLTGLLLKIPFLDEPTAVDAFYDDQPFFAIPGDPVVVITDDEPNETELQQRETFIKEENE